MRKILALTVFVGGLFLSVSPAFAHVEIVSASPEPYTNVTPIPSQLWIEFSGPLQTLDGQVLSSLEVIDSTGIAVNFQDPVIEGGRITTKISGQSAPGAFTVKYRVVGEDGHVIEGDYTFNASPNYSASDGAKAVPAKVDSSFNPILGASIVLAAGLGIGFLIRQKRAA